MNFTIIEDKFESFSHQFTEIPRFTELKTKIDLSPLQIVKNLGTDEMFVGKKANPDDNLPEPNSSEGGAPCTDSADCIGFQLKIMK